MCHIPCQGEPRNAVYDQQQQSSNLQLAAASSERSADILITTADSDTVKLSIDSRIQAVALTYDEKARTGSGYSQTHGELVGIDVDRQVELSVKGDFDGQERKEIKQVLKAIFKMVKNFLSGKFGNGADHARKFDDLETIANVSAKFEARDTAAYVSQSAAEEITRVQAAPSGIEPLPSGEGRDRPPEINPALYAKPIQADNTRPAITPVEDLADKMTAVVKESGVDPAKIQKPVDDMFGRLMNRFLREGPFSFRKMRRLSGLMEEFSRKLSRLMNPEKPDLPTLEPQAPGALEPIAPMEIFTLKQSTVQAQASILEKHFSFSFDYSADESDTAGNEDVSVEA
jgi:hypothetical protein